MNSKNELEKLIENLPLFIQSQLFNHKLSEELIEILLDLGRRPEVRFSDRVEYLSYKFLHGKILIMLLNELVNLVMKIERVLIEHFIE